MKIKVMCIKDCSINKELINGCIIKFLVSFDFPMIGNIFIKDKVYDITEYGYEETKKYNVFIPLSEWREKRINEILDETND